VHLCGRKWSVHAGGFGGWGRRRATWIFTRRDCVGSSTANEEQPHFCAFSSVYGPVGRCSRNVALTAADLAPPGAAAAILRLQRRIWPRRALQPQFCAYSGGFGLVGRCSRNVALTAADLAPSGAAAAYFRFRLRARPHRLYCLAAVVL